MYGNIPAPQWRVRIGTVMLCASSRKRGQARALTAYAQARAYNSIDCVHKCVCVYCPTHDNNTIINNACNRCRRGTQRENLTHRLYTSHAHFAARFGSRDSDTQQEEGCVFEWLRNYTCNHRADVSPNVQCVRVSADSTRFSANDAASENPTINTHNNTHIRVKTTHHTVETFIASSVELTEHFGLQTHTHTRLSPLPARPRVSRARSEMKTINQAHIVCVRVRGPHKSFNFGHFICVCVVIWPRNNSARKASVRQSCVRPNTHIACRPAQFGVVVTSRRPRAEPYVPH